MYCVEDFEIFLALSWNSIIAIILKFETDLKLQDTKRSLRFIFVYIALSRYSFVS